jgi:hypothetical protein
VSIFPVSWLGTQLRDGCRCNPRTGATGYIGGDALYTLVKAHPDWEISALVRSKEKGNMVTSQHPSVRLVHGDLDSAQLLEEEAAKADIVFRMAIPSELLSCWLFILGLDDLQSEN